MQIRIQATANLGQAEAQFAALQTQVDRLNASLARTALVPQGGTVKGFTQAQSAARGAERQFANALAASGAFRAEQVRLPSIINKTTEALQAQKLSFAQVFGKQGRANMRAVYKEQLAMRQAFASQTTGTVGHGRTGMTMAIPQAVSKSWDSAASRVGFLQAKLKSVSTQMINTGKQMQWSGRQLMTGLTLPVLAFGAAAGVMAYQVNKQFTRIKKVYDTTADANSTLASEMAAYAKEIGELQAKSFGTAEDAARSYGVSVTDTLSVQADLAATGQKGAALQAATTQVVRNATLGEIEYQVATSATIALQQQLHLSNQDLADSWAYMNSVENATSLGMKDFAVAIPIALAPIRQMGGDLQDLGTLMTAMVSRGVEVGKAANAIKAMPARLSNPAKSTQELFKKLTGQDIVELNKRNPDNIIGLLQSIGDATKDLDTLSKRQALGKLFGTYQLSTMTAMLGGMEDLKDGIGQTSDAFEIGTQSAKQWSEVSDREIKAFQQSTAGRFKIAFQTIKAELASMGDPFLKVATKFLDFGTMIFKFFNGLPSLVKNGFMFTVFLGAILGPIVMLSGLFYQLIGNVGKMFAGFLNLAKGLKVLTIAQHAQAFESKLVEKGWISQQSESSLLTARMEALTAATLAQSQAMTAMAASTAAANGAMGAMGRNLPIVKAYPKTPPTAAQLQQSVAQAMAQQGVKTNSKGQSYWGAGSGKSGFAAKAQVDAIRASTEATVRAQYALAEAHMKTLGFVSLEVEEGAAINAAQKFRLDQERMITLEREKQVAALAAARAAEKNTTVPLSSRGKLEAARKAEKATTVMTAQQHAAAVKADIDRTKATEKRVAAAKAEATVAKGTARAMSGAAVAGGAMAASMALMMLTTNETANNIGKWLMISAIAVPAMVALKPAAAAVGTSMVAAAAAARATMTATIGTTVAAGRAAGMIGVMRGAMIGAKEAALAIMGPIGWSLAAATAIGIVLYKIHKSNQKEIAEQVANQKALADGAKNYAEYLGTAAGNFDKIALATAKATADSQDDYEKSYAYYTDEKNGKAEIEGYKELTTETQKRAAAIQKMTELMVINKLTSEQATTNIAAFFAASGQSMTEASYNAQILAEELGKVEDLDYSKALDNLDKMVPPQWNASDMDLDVYTEMIEQNAIKYGELWSAGFSNALDPDAANDFIQQLTLKAYSGYQEMLDRLKNGDWGEDQEGVDKMLDLIEARADKYNESQAQALRGIIKDGDFNSVDIFGTEQGKMWNQDIEAASDYEKNLVKAIVASQHLDENIDTLAELTGDAAITSKTLTYEEAVAEAQQLSDAWQENNSKLLAYRTTLRNLPTDQKFARRSLEPFLASLDNDTLATIGLDDKSVHEDDTYSDDNLKRMDLTRDKLLELVELGFQNNKVGALAAINQENLVQGFKQGLTPAEALYNLLNKIPAEIEDAAQEARKLTKNLLASGNIKFKFGQGDLPDIANAIKSSYAAVQDQMSQMASEQLDAQAEASADSVQKYWDRRADQLDAAQEAQTQRLADMQQKAQDRFDESQQRAQDQFDRGQEKAQRKFARKQETEQERFDARWERRKNAIQNASDARIASIQKEIDAEQKADDARQAMFEAEQRRIDRLAESANQGIDFNIALSTGDIDQAAKLQNDISATAAGWAVEDNRDRTSAESKRKIDGLNATKEAIEKETEAELANLEKAEKAASESFKRRQERAQRHFQRLQELEQRAFQKSQELESRRFQKSQEMQQKNLEKTQERAKEALEMQTANAKAANEAEWAARKASLDKQLALFTAFTVSSKAQLDKWMAKTGLSYSDFGIKSGEWFNKAFKEQLRMEGAQLGSDSMWAALGNDVAKQTIRGMGFGGLKGFAQFIKTGKLPENFGKKKNTPTTSYGDDHRSPQNNHGGGLIGEGGSGRKGVARNIKGVGPGERIVRARNNEFMVNERATKKHLPLLRAINDGRVNASPRNIGRGVGGGVNPGLGGFAAGMVGAGIASGVGQALTNAYNAKRAETAAASIFGGGYSGVFGSRVYSLPGVMPWVAEAAQYLGNMFNIGTIGGVGERGNVSEHPLGRALDFMTSGLANSQGDALAEEVVKRHDALDAMYVIWRQKINSFDGRGWRDMEDRGDPTANHMDHVHVSFNPTGDLGDLPKMKAGDKVDYAGMLGGIIGMGGKAMPSVPGKGWRNSHDYANGENSPLFAFNDAKVVESRALMGGKSKYPGSTPGYYSYGETMVLRDSVGNTLRYAHMAPGSRGAAVGKMLTGGQLMGLSGWTGNASGPHTHFEWNGSTAAREGLARYGISLEGSGSPARSGGIGGEGDGVDPGGAWTYGDLPGQMGYDPYTAMNEWLAAQAEERARAEAKAARQAGKGTKAAKQAQRQALLDAIAKEEENLHKQKAVLDYLRSQNPKPQGKIDGALAIKEKIKARLEAAELALKDWRNANKGIDDGDDAVDSGNTLKTGTYNMLHSSPNSGTQADLHKLFGLTDVLSLTEFSGKKKELTPWINSRGWGIAGEGENVVAYNKSKYNASSTGKIQLNRTEGEAMDGSIGTGGARRLDAAYTMLKGQNGAKFWQIAAHTIAHIWKNPELNRKVQQEQFGSLADLGGRLGKNGTPVFIGGDLNNDPRAMEGRRPGGRQGMRFFQSLVDAGFSTNWSKEAMAANAATMGDRYIDHVMYKNAKLLSTKTIAGLTSDHNAVVSEFSLPQLSKGAENIRWDNTLVNMHKRESVLTADQSGKFRYLADNLDEIATGGKTEYNTTVEVKNPRASATEIANKVNQINVKHDRRKATRRTVSI